MNHKIVLTSFVLVFLLWAAAVPAEDKVILPNSYTSGQFNYPVIYVLPDSLDDTASVILANALSLAMTDRNLDMILVLPELTDTENVRDSLHACIERTDNTYRTIPISSSRFLAGTGAGGYLSYILGLTEPELFGGVASIGGRFTGEGNPWFSTLGSVYDLIDTLHSKSPEILSSVYTYLDAPTDDPNTDMPGSTNDIGRRLISYRLPAAIHEFTVRPGFLDDAFLKESATRLMCRLTDLRLPDIIRGSFRLNRSRITVGESVLAEGSIQCSDTLSVFGVNVSDVSLILNVYSNDNHLIDSHSIELTADSEKTVFSCPLSLPNLPKHTSQLRICLSAQLFSKSFLIDENVLVVSAPDSGNSEKISLEGDWYFRYTGRGQPDISGLTPDIFTSWTVVQPGLGNWTKGYGNIDETTVSAGAGQDSFDFFITGNGYYARTFDLPEDFKRDNCVLSIGYVDDRCEVWLNGERIGETGMTGGRSNGQTSWAKYSAFPLPLNTLRIGENTVIVRCFNDLPYGAGGWYDGPIGLYSAAAFAEATGSQADPRFYEETFPSRYAADATGKDSPINVPYLIYLPEGYADSLRSYPTVYLLHQYNSDYTSYRRDNVKQLLDEGIAAGDFDEMIVIIPNSSENSWWHNAWEKMVTDELVPYIDAHYRTIQDSRWRLTAGCSMGGQGAFGIALRNPDLFSGAISFFGAFSYGGDANPNLIAVRESSDYLKYYTLYFICGNQDDYGFGMPAIDLHQCLLSKGIPHRFFIENGSHNSTFYVPYFKDAFAYVRGKMANSQAVNDDLLSGQIQLSASPCLVISCSGAVSTLQQQVPESVYTRMPNPDLFCRLYLTIDSGNETKCLFTCSNVSLVPDMKLSIPLPEDCLTPDLPDGRLLLQVALFDRLLTLDSVDWPQ